MTTSDSGRGDATDQAGGGDSGLADAALGDSAPPSGFDGGDAAGRPPTDGSTDAPTTGPQSFTWEFSSTTEGWVGGFADYPSGEDSFYELSFQQASLPSELGSGGGLEISGNNHSDDLFMYVTRQITGLLPSTAYAADVTALIGTNAPSDCLGVGGGPGTSVYFKAGATSFEPSTSEDTGGLLRMNLDKGNQSQGGADMRVVDHIGSTRPCPDDAYEHKTMTLTDFVVESDASGALWLILGTDSGFEATTTLYYDRIEVTLTPEG